MFTTLYENGYKRWGITKKQFYEVFLVLYLFKICNSAITFKILNPHNRRPKIFAFDIFGLKCCLHLYMPWSSCPRRHVLEVKGTNILQLFGYQLNLIFFLFFFDDNYLNVQSSSSIFGCWVELNCIYFSCTVLSNQIGTVRKRNFYINLQFMNNTFRQSMNKRNFC